MKHPAPDRTDMQWQPFARWAGRHAPILILAAGILLLLPGIWSETGITSKDEYWLSLRTPLETMARGDWITNWVNGEPRLRKPPLLYWAILAGYKLFGVSLLAARIWGVLAGAGLALCSCLLARRLFHQTGLLAGLLTLSTVGVAIEARQALLDLPLACLSCLSTYFALRWWQTGRPGLILAAATSLGLSFLVKGPIGLYFFAASAGSGLWVFGGWGRLPSRASHLWYALLLLLAVCLPWPLLMSCLWPGFAQVLGQEMGQRNFGRLDLFSPFSALGGALGLIFPWTPVLLAALAGSLLRVRTDFDQKNRWMLFWYLGSTLPLFFMESFERYLLPAIPPMCVLCAGWLGEDIRGPLPERADSDGVHKSRPVPGRLPRIVLGISVAVAAPIVLALCLFFLWFGIAVGSTVLTLCILSITVTAAFRTASPAVPVLAMAFLLASLFGAMYPALGIESLPAGIEHTVGDRPAAVYGGAQPGMLSMRLKRSVIPLEVESEAGPHSLGSFHGFVFLERFNAPRFESAAARFPIQIEKAGSFKTFYSRKVWVRFARQDATRQDWKRAIEARSLEDLKTEMVYYRVFPKESGT